MTLLRTTLDDKYKLEHGQIYLSAIQALVRLPMLQHILDKRAGHNTAGFISGYRGSPLGGYDKALWSAKKFLDEHKIVFKPGLNEDLGATAIWGTQQVNLFEGGIYDGVFSLWYGKGPGIDRSGDVFKHGNAAGTSPLGGVLVLAGDDHACRSSTLPHQSEYSFMDAMIPVLNPSGIKELISFGLYGIAMSRFSGCWVAMKVIEETADSSASLNLDLSQFSYTQPQDFIMPDGGINIRTPDTPLAQESRLHQYKLPAVLAFARANRLDRIALKSDNPRLGIVTTGKAYEDVLQALTDMGITKTQAQEAGISIYKVGMTWPLEPVGLTEFALGLEELIIIEEKRPVIEDQIKTLLYNMKGKKPALITGKCNEKGEVQFPSTTELTPALIAKGLQATLKKYLKNAAPVKAYLDDLEKAQCALNAPAMLRIPYYCAGCPHNSSTKVPEGSRALAGIGCHYMVTWMNRSTSTFTQMGGEGVPWIGQAPFTTTKHVFANLGDGTYYHSGILAIRATVASGVNITYKLLYNDAVAMTGGQPMDGPFSIPQLIAQMRAEGVAEVFVASDDIDKYRTMPGMPTDIPLVHRDDLENLQVKMREIKGTSILIYDQTCAAEKRRRRKRKLMEDPPKRVFINEAVCEGCGDCGKASNCVAIAPAETEFGRKRQIDQSSCNKDYSCVNGFCPSFVTVHGGKLRSRSNRIDKEHGAFGRLPLPHPVELTGVYDIVVTGVGGTGVVTIGALIGMAAHLEKKGCTVLDITGLAQKNGQVTCYVRLANHTDDINAVRISSGNADLVIGSDYVVTAHTDVLEKMRQGTKIVLDPKRTMAGDFTQNPDAVFPEQKLRDSLIATVGADNLIDISAHDLATELMGDAIYTNCFLMGYAFQKGLLPLTHQSLEKAIELNGASVEQNKLAFACGRWAATDYPAMQKFLGLDKEPQQPKTFDERLVLRRDTLIAYQNVAYADRYTDLVMQVEKKEAELGFDKGPLSEAVMKYYFKLLAYKDEYEVGRLYAHPDFKKALKHQFEGGYSLEFHLAPPLIAKRDPRTRHLKKQAYGEFMLTAFKILSKLKFLRGSMLDPFGHTKERRNERALITTYEKDMAMILGGLTKANYDAAIAVASLPEEIRGYGHVKEKHMKAAKDKRIMLLGKFKAHAKAAA